jgi:hypothetical protein
LAKQEKLIFNSLANQLDKKKLGKTHLPARIYARARIMVAIVEGEKK